MLVLGLIVSLVVLGLIVAESKRHPIKRNKSSSLYYIGE